MERRHVDTETRKHEGQTSEAPKNGETSEIVLLRTWGEGKEDSGHFNGERRSAEEVRGASRNLYQPNFTQAREYNESAISLTCIVAGGGR